MKTVDELLEGIGAPVIVATHPRSGTHLTIDFLRKQFAECQSWLYFGETLHHLYLDLNRLATSTSTPALSVEAAAELLHRPDRPVVKTHSRPAMRDFEERNRTLAEGVFARGQIIHVVRDGRDVLCSDHRRMQARLSRPDLSLSEFLRWREKGVNRVRYWADHAEAWSQRDDAKTIRFEDLVQSTETVLGQLSAYLRMDALYQQPYLPKKTQRGGRWADYWRRLTRQHESTAIHGRPGGRAPSKWRQAFTPEDRQFFQDEAGHVLEKLGYEKTPSWTNSEALS